MRYKLRNAIKGKVLANFLVEFTPTMNSVARVSSVSLRLWQVYMDGASNAQGVRGGIVLVSPKGIRLEHSLRLSFRASNNEVEYEALIAGLRQLRSWMHKWLGFFFFRFSFGGKSGIRKF